MDKREQLANLLITNFGMELYPKADGRVEVPQCLVSSADWHSCRSVYMSSNMDGIIYISSSSDLMKDDTVTITVAVSSGRLRIPAGFLKKVGLYGKRLSATHDGDSMLMVRPDNSKNDRALEELLGSFLDSQITELLNILTGEEIVDNNLIPNRDIVRVSVNCKDFPEPSMFLLEGDEARTCIFRPVGNPYKFKCCWVDKKPFLVKPSFDNENVVTLYAVPGLKRIKREDGGGVPGYLILDPITFGKVCYIVKLKQEKTAIGKDLIFIFSPKTKVGSFKVFENPTEDLDDEVIERAKLVCANPERFLSDSLELFCGGQCDSPPTTITVNTFGNKRDQ